VTETSAERRPKRRQHPYADVADGALTGSAADVATLRMI
jgi:hypothetical protein